MAQNPERPNTWIVKPEDRRHTGLDVTCLAWGFIKEKEPHNSLKRLYSKYVLKDKEDLII